VKPERLPSGRWKVRFRHGVSRTTGQPLQTSETFDTRREAERFASWVHALGPQGALDKLYADEQSARTPTLSEVAAEHINNLTAIEPGTRLSYHRLWSRTWGRLIGETPVNRVTDDAVSAAVRQLALRYSEKSLKNQRGLLSAVLDRAVRHHYLTANPARGVKLPRGARGGEDDVEMVCLTTAEWDALYAAMSAHYRPLARFLVGTGCRWGEAVVLRVGDVDLDARTVRFRRALKWSPDGQRRVGVTKTRRSKRTVALPPEVVGDLGPLLEGVAGRDLVFTAPRGGPVAHRTFWSDHWRPAIWRAQHCPVHTPAGCLCGTAHPKRCAVHDRAPDPCGCEGTLRQTPRIHDLRHTHVSWLLAAGVPIHVVQARLGHESIQTTVDTYSHLLPDAQLAAAAAAQAAFARQGRSLGLLDSPQRASAALSAHVEGVHQHAPVPGVGLTDRQGGCDAGGEDGPPANRVDSGR
jgi:integrase